MWLVTCSNLQPCSNYQPCSNFYNLRSGVDKLHAAPLICMASMLQVAFKLLILSVTACNNGLHTLTVAT